MNDLPNASSRGLPALVLISAWVGGMTSAVADPATYRYTAQQGDTLIALGQSLLERPAEWPRLQQINRITNPRRIPVGQVIQIPVTMLRAKEAPARVVQLSGSASLIQAGQSRPLSIGAPWEPGSEIRTGSDGYVTVRLADGSLLKVQSATVARLDRAQHYERPGFFATALQVLQGRIEAAVTHLTGGEPRFQVSTPQATLGVRGTDFRVAAQPETGTSWGEVLTGRVDVTGHTASPRNKAANVVSLQAGQGALVNAQSRVGSPITLPQAPDLRALPDLHDRPVVTLNLPPVADASLYRAQAALDAEFTQVMAEATSPTPTLRLTGLPDGPYHLRVRVAQAQGLEGPDGKRTFVLKARPEPPNLVNPGPDAKHRGLGIPLHWTEPPEASRYRLQISQNGQWQRPVVDLPAITSSTWHQSLPPGTYQWRLASVRANGDAGPFGDARSFTLLPPPADLPPPQVTEQHLQFSWPAEPGQTCGLQMARDDAFTLAVTTVKSTQPQVQVDRPQPGGRWWVRTRATDADGYVGPYSTPQVLHLPSCAIDRQGDCLRSGDGQMLRSR